MIYGLVAPGYDMAEVTRSIRFWVCRCCYGEDIDMSGKLKLIVLMLRVTEKPFMPVEKGYSIIYENKTKAYINRINVSHDGKSYWEVFWLMLNYNMFHQIYLNGNSEDAEELLIRK
jgi:nitrite reductase (NADH) large subunit